VHASIDPVPQPFAIRLPPPLQRLRDRRNACPEGTSTIGCSDTLCRETGGFRLATDTKLKIPRRERLLQRIEFQTIARVLKSIDQLARSGAKFLAPYFRTYRLLTFKYSTVFGN